MLSIILPHASDRDERTQADPGVNGLGRMLLVVPEEAGSWVRIGKPAGWKNRRDEAAARRSCAKDWLRCGIGES